MKKLKKCGLIKSATYCSGLMLRRKKKEQSEKSQRKLNDPNRCLEVPYCESI